MASSPPLSLADANQRQSQALRAATLTALANLWLRLGSWRDTDIERFLRLALPLVRGAQTRMSALTAAYLARQVAALAGHPVLPVPAPRVGEVRGVPLTEEYARPFHDVWRALGDGRPLPEAVKAGQDRLASLASTDLQLTKTHASRAILTADKRVTGYRRVLEGAYSCGLCIVASTQRYHVADLMPIHPACDCSVAPIVGESDPGHVIDEQRLADAHAAIADRFGRKTADARGGRGIPNYHDVLVTHDHGELGPVLGVRGQDFTGPSDLH